MIDHVRSTSWRYTLALVASVATLAMRIGLEQLVKGSSPYLFFIPAVMFSAWFGGLGPGVVATLIGGVCGHFLLLEPYRGFSLLPADIPRMTIFLLGGFQISYLSGEMYAARRRAEADAAAARASERLYRTLASNFPDGFVCLFDRDLRWTLVAGAGLAAAGLSREAMEGQSVGATLPPGTAAHLQAMCHSAAATGTDTSAEVALRDRVYFVHALPLRGPADAADHAGMVIVEDVTDRVRARESLQWAHDNLERAVRQRTAELLFQKSLLESQNQASVEGILAVGIDDRVIFANRRFHQMWQVETESGRDTAADLRQRMRQLMVTPEDPLADAAPDRPIRVAGAAEPSAEIVTRDGRTIERYTAPVVDAGGTSYGRVWFFRDITERKRLEREILEAGERERRRIGQDLHDDLCQQLTGIACMGRVLQRHLVARANGSGPPPEAAEAGEIVRMVQQATERARDLAKGLRPLELQDRGLPAALQELCAGIRTMFDVACTFHGDEGAAGAAGAAAVTVTDDVAIQLYRIAQEAISNAIRHGKAPSVRIDLVTVGGRLIMTIEDDGIGIPDPIPRGGFGLYSMDYRALMIGGLLTVERGKPAGTVVTCSVPLAGAERDLTAAAVTERGEA